MKLEILQIKGNSDKEKERVIFKVLQTCNLGSYIVALSQELSDGIYSSRINNVFWFPDKEVKENDLVVLYTKLGSQNSIVNENGTTTHFIYWGLDNTLTSDDKSCIVLLEAKWRFKSISQLSED